MPSTVIYINFSSVYSTGVLYTELKLKLYMLCKDEIHCIVWKSISDAAGLNCPLTDQPPQHFFTAGSTSTLMHDTKYIFTVCCFHG